MSEASETKGRCRREFESYYADKQVIPSESDWILADGIDRLAAELAAIKAKVDSVEPEDVEHFVEAEKAWLALVEGDRDAAIRERDKAIRERGEAWDEIRRAKTELAERPWPVGWMVEVERLKGRTSEAIKERDAAIRERDEARAEAERLRMQLVACSVLANSNTTESLERSRRVHPDYECDAVQSVIRAVEREITARSEAERLKAELAEARAETQRIQDEADDREETERVKRLNAEIEKTHRTLLNRTWERDIAKAEAERLRAELAARPAAAGWLTEEEKGVIEELLPYTFSGQQAGVLTNLLARAGSPPVVEVPVMHVGGIHEVIHNQYRAALDKAGVQWKEVPRE